MLRLVAALAGLLAVSTATARPFDVRDLVMLDRISDPRVSPDGKSVVFQVRETDFDANKGVNGLWLRALSGDQPARRLTTKGVNSLGPRWAPDGKSIYFISSKSGTAQVWRVGPAGGEAKQVTDFALDIGAFAVSPTAPQLLVAMDVFPDCADLACTKKRIDDKAASKVTGVIHDQLFVRHWDTWKNGTRAQLFVADLDGRGNAPKEPRRLTVGIDGDVPSKPFGDDAEFAYSPDGKRVVFAARIAGRTEPWSTNFDLFLVDVAGGTAKNLTQSNPAWDTGPAFSRDGRTLYYRAMKRPGFEADRFGLMTMDLATGKAREIAPGWDRSADNTVLSRDGRTLYTTTNDVGETALYAIDVASGKPEKIAAKGHVAAFSVGDDEVVFARDDLRSPAQLFRAGLRGGSESQLTDVNKARLAEIEFGAFEQFEFAGWNDETVHGYVVKPHGYKEGSRYPVAFIIHGGPQGSMGNSFHYRWNPQTYAGRGFAVVFVDFHGSTGYGQAFTDSISGDWGGKPLEDLQKGLAHALESYAFLDADRVCALGASYGGYMVNWIAGNWSEPFRCLVNHDGVFDKRMMAYSTEELWFDEWENGGPAFDTAENREKHNPVRFVSKWSKPMLVVQGGLDFRIPLEQGLATFTALQRRGIESRFLYFPDENHWVLKPQNSVLWHDTVNAWLEQHL